MIYQHNDPNAIYNRCIIRGIKPPDMRLICAAVAITSRKS